MLSNKYISILISAIAVFWVLSLLQGILVPLVVAIFFVMVLQPILGFLHGRKFPNWLAVTIISILSLFTLLVVLTIVSETVSQIANSGDTFINAFNRKFDSLIEWFNRTTNYRFQTWEIKKAISDLFTGEFIKSALGKIASSVGSFTSSFFMFGFYFIILLSSFYRYREFILFVGGDENGPRFIKTFENVMKSISTYISVKFVISLVTGFFFWLFSTIFNIPFPLFWGFLAFAMNFIPSIGSIIATFVVILMAFVSLDSFLSVLLYSISVIGTQVVFGNILDPIIMGNRLQLNTLTVLLGLVFWGFLWGIPGMLLAVPLLVLIKIILSQNPQTEMFARAMGTTKQQKSNKKEPQKELEK